MDSASSLNCYSHCLLPKTIFAVCKHPEDTGQNRSNEGSLLYSLFASEISELADCKDAMSWIRTSTDSIQAEVSESVYFRNLSEGLYCLRIRKTGDFHVTWATQACNITDAATQPITLESHSESELFKGVNFDNGIIFAIVLLVCCIAILAFAVIHKRRTNGNSNKSESATCLPEISISAGGGLVPVLLLYYADNDHFLNIIQRFTEYLENNGCSVSHYLNTEDNCALLVDEFSWLHSKLTNGSKVIFVSSRGASEMEQGKNLKAEEIGFRLCNNIFKLALETFRSNAHHAFNYSSLYLVKFSCTSDEFLLRGLSPNRYFDIPSHLTNLLDALHDFNRPGLVDDFNMFSNNVNSNLHCLIRDYDGHQHIT